MVAVLLAASGVPSSSLDVTVGGGTDPDVAPGRRDRKLADTPQGISVPDPPAVGVDVHESRSPADSLESAQGIGIDMTQARPSRGVPGSRVKARVARGRDRSFVFPGHDVPPAGEHRVEMLTVCQSPGTRQSRRRASSQSTGRDADNGLMRLEDVFRCRAAWLYEGRCIWHGNGSFLCRGDSSNGWDGARARE
jgi:hypothetical protein